MRRQFFSSVTLGLVFAGVSLLTSSAWAQKSESQVKVTATASKPDADGKTTVTVSLAIAKGWHVYANPVGNTDLIDTQTTVRVLSAGKTLEAQVAYPAGKLVVDKTAGNYSIYEETVSLKATVKRSADDKGALEVHVKLQVCGDGKCLLPGTIKVPVEVK